MLADCNIASVRTPDTKETVLHIAVKLFVDYGAVDYGSSNNNNQAHRALLEDIAATWHGVPHIGDALESVDAGGLTALSLVALSGNTEAARLIDPLAQSVCNAKKTKLETAAALASSTGNTEAIALAASLTSLAARMGPWSAALLTAIHSPAEDLVQFLIGSGAARHYLMCADIALLMALSSIPMPRAQRIAQQFIGKAPFFEYLASLCQGPAASAMSSIVVPVAELVNRAFAQSDLGLVPCNTALPGDLFTMGMLFGCAVVCAVVSSIDGGAATLSGLFFSPAFLTDVFYAPHDQGSMCPYAFQAREGLHRIIAPEVLFGMVSIAGTDHTEFQRLICKVGPVYATEDLLVDALW